MSSKGVRKLSRYYNKECMLSHDKFKLTYHHIQRKASGGDKTVENGAILSDSYHKWLHNFLEHKYPETAELLNESLLLYKLALDLKMEELINAYNEEVLPEVQALYEKAQYQKIKKFNQGGNPK